MFVFTSVPSSIAKLQTLGLSQDFFQETVKDNYKNYCYNKLCPEINITCSSDEVAIIEFSTQPSFSICLAIGIANNCFPTPTSTPAPTPTPSTSNRPTEEPAMTMIEYIIVIAILVLVLLMCSCVMLLLCCKTKFCRQKVCNRHRVVEEGVPDIPLTQLPPRAPSPTLQTTPPDKESICTSASQPQSTSLTITPKLNNGTLSIQLSFTSDLGGSECGSIVSSISRSSRHTHSSGYNSTHSDQGVLHVNKRSPGVSSLSHPEAIAEETTSEHSASSSCHSQQPHPLGQYSHQYVVTDTDHTKYRKEVAYGSTRLSSSV